MAIEKLLVGLITGCCLASAYMTPRYQSTRVSGALFATETRSGSCSIDITPPTPKRRWPRSTVSPEPVTAQIEYTMSQTDVAGNAPTRAILLIHPIGVGIGRWYYDRLLVELSQQSFNNQRTIILAPDLLACGSANHIVGVDTVGFPLFGVHDWASQILQLMQQVEQQQANTFEWCLVSNGGCVPIAVEVAAQYVDSNRGKLTHMILSATPRLAGLVRDAPPSEKVAKSYKFLSGLFGRLFWWYSLRRNGKFIQKFTERNLVADPDNIGEEWTPTCVETGKMPNTRYSTFMFLAGALQHDCRSSFAKLANRVKIGVITGGDKRRNPARSWLWTRKRRRVPDPSDAQHQQTLPEYLELNGNGGKEIVVGGRRCPAYEDVAGFANALKQLLSL